MSSLLDVQQLFSNEQKLYVERYVPTYKKKEDTFYDDHELKITLNTYIIYYKSL